MITTTVRGFADQRIAIQTTSLRMSTIDKYRQIFRKYLFPEFGDKRPQDITPEMVEEFKLKLMSEYGLSIHFVKDILMVFNSLMRYIETLHPDFTPILASYPRERKKDMRILSDYEIETFTCFLMNNLNPCTFGIILSLYSGLRIGEISALKWSDIDLKEKTISVSRTLQRVASNGDSDNRTCIYIGEPKTESSIRTIPLSRDIIVLCEQMEKSADSYVLTGTPKYMEPRVLQYRLKKYLDSCNIHDVHFHTLRHTFASRCIESGVEIKALSEILGHSSTTITFDRYVHTTMNFKRENIDKVHFIKT